jgi:hypothetical protein
MKLERDSHALFAGHPAVEGELLFETLLRVHRKNSTSALERPEGA